MSPKLEGMILCMVVPWVDCMCLVTLGRCGWHGLGVLGHSVLEFSWWNGCSWSRHGLWHSLCRGHTGRTAEAELGTRWGRDPVALHTEGGLEGQLKVKGTWTGVLLRLSVKKATWQDSWSLIGYKTGLPEATEPLFKYSQFLSIGKIKIFSMKAETYQLS